MGLVRLSDVAPARRAAPICPPQADSVGFDSAHARGCGEPACQSVEQGTRNPRSPAASAFSATLDPHSARGVLPLQSAPRGEVRLDGRLVDCRCAASWLCGYAVRQPRYACLVAARLDTDDDDAASHLRWGIPYFRVGRAGAGR